jgi:hypothetical protein
MKWPAFRTAPACWNNPRRIGIQPVPDFVCIAHRVITLSTSNRANMAAVHFRSVPDHELMHTAAHQRVHAQLEALPYADVCRQKAVALAPRFVLLVYAIAVSIVRVAYRLGHLVHRLRARLFHGATQIQYKCLKEIAEPFEHHVVLCHLTCGIPRHPAADHYRKRDVVERGEGEVDPCGCGGDITHSCELDYLVLVRMSNDGERLRWHEETKNVLRVELAAHEGTRVGYAALDL